MDVVVNEATEEDAERISGLDDLVFPEEGLSPRTVARDLRHGSRAFLAERGGRLAAFVLFRPGEVGDVLRLAVLEGDRGCGLGTTLLRGALAVMPDPVILTVRKANAGARRLYGRHGFRVVAEIEASWLMRRG